MNRTGNTSFNTGGISGIGAALRRGEAIPLR